MYQKTLQQVGFLVTQGDPVRPMLRAREHGAAVISDPHGSSLSFMSLEEIESEGIRRRARGVVRRIATRASEERDVATEELM